MRTERDGLLSLQRFFGGLLPEPWDVRTDLEAGAPPERPFALVELAGAGETSGAPVTQDLVIPMTANLYLERGDTREAATAAALELREQVWAAVKWGPDLRRATTDRIPLYAYEPRAERHRFRVSGATGGTFVASVDGHDAAPLAPTVSAMQLAAAIEAGLLAGGVELTAGDVVGYDRGVGLWDVHYGGSLAGRSIGEPAIDGGALEGSLAEVSARTVLEAAPSPWRGASDYMKVSSFSQNTVRDVSDPALVMVAVDLRLTFARGLPLPLDQRILQRVSATGSNG